MAFSLCNYTQVRFRIWTNLRPILGWPRKTLLKMGRKYPEAHLYNWRPYLPEDGSYTTRLLPICKLGGRDMESGRVVVHTLGGGNPKRFRWVDMYRRANDDGSVREEQVLKIQYDPLHTPNIALVADKDRARWIFASDGMKENDIVRTHSELPKIPIKPKVGDAHPIGAFAVGSRVNSIEIRPGQGAKFCLAAGSSAEVVKRTADEVTVKLPSDDTFTLDAKCMAVAGQLSNPGHKDIHLWCPQRLRWLGKRPRSGQWHKKDGYCGRKLHRPKAIDLTTRKLNKDKEAQLEKEIYDLSNY